MNGYQRVEIIGNVGRDPEMKYGGSGDAICSVPVAVAEKWKDRAGEKRERTEWFNVTAFGKLAEIIGQYVKKGNPIFVAGAQRTEEYTDKEGVKRRATKLIASEMRLLGGRDGGQSQQEAPRQQAKAPEKPKDAPPPDYDFEDVPF